MPDSTWNVHRTLSNELQSLRAFLGKKNVPAVNKVEKTACQNYLEWTWQRCPVFRFLIGSRFLKTKPKQFSWGQRQGLRTLFRRLWSQKAFEANGPGLIEFTTSQNKIYSIRVCFEQKTTKPWQTMSWKQPIKVIRIPGCVWNYNTCGDDFSMWILIITFAGL